MNQLVSAIANRVKSDLIATVRSLPPAAPQLRRVFHGPPLSYLGAVYDELTRGDGLQVDLSTGQTLSVPVLLQVDRLGEGQTLPAIGESGWCDENHLLRLRNTPECRVFLALVPPGQHRASVSVTSTTDESGIAASANSGNATIDDWLQDHFVQTLIDTALDRYSWRNESQRNHAKRLLEKAIWAANDADRHDVARENSWALLSRVLSIPPSIDFPLLWSFACGYPPMADGSLSAEEQIKALEELAVHIGDVGFKPTFDELKDELKGNVEDRAIANALDACLAHLISACDVPTAFAAATPFYYTPARGSGLDTPPEWWPQLTVECWTDLLEDVRDPEGSLHIECLNSLIPRCKGINGVVTDQVELAVSYSDRHQVVDAVINRQVGGRANHASWQVRLPDDTSVIDDNVPEHRTPARYTIEGPGLRKANVKIVSLQSWEPGVFIFCRTARRLEAPKKARQRGADLECSLILIGQGRHYIDVYVRPTVCVSDSVTGKSETPHDTIASSSFVSQVSESTYGFEVDATSECYYDIVITEGGVQRTLRLNITCDDTVPEGCASEFERLIRLNRQSTAARAMTDVQIDRQARITDLQSWLLDPIRVRRSFYPIVLAGDYSTRWRSPEWRAEQDTILSKGRFLHDPRPPLAEMTPPSAYLNAREKLAELIRGDDGNGLIEAFGLGIRAAGDAGVAELVHEYVRAYLEWLDADPETAVWSDLVIITGAEPGGDTLVQEPDAILVSPLHPLRIGWHCVASPPTPNRLALCRAAVIVSRVQPAAMSGRKYT